MGRECLSRITEKKAMKRKLLKIKYLPIPLGLALALVGLAGGLFLINRANVLFSRASSEAEPQNIKITNLSSSSFVVSWITSQATSGLISLGETSQTGLIKKDVRDQNSNQTGKFKTHYVFVDNLKPQTKYYFKILSGSKSYLNAGKPFEVITAPEKAFPDADLASGRVITADNQPVAGALVFLTLANTLTQSAITDSDGHWVIPLSNARTPDLVNFSPYDRSAQIEEISVLAESGSAQATLTTANDNPTPDIILNQNQNFLNQFASPTATPNPQYQSNLGELASPSALQEKETELSITFPAANEKVNNSLPEFFGTAPKGQKLEIKVESEQAIASQAQTDQTGSWKWSPSIPLTPGEHTITVSYTDKNGLLKTVSRSFVVLATGESSLPSFTATPSGKQISPTPLPTSLPTATPTPFKALTPTLTPTSKVEASPTSSESVSVPKTGIDLPTKILISSGTGILLLGVLLILF